MKKCVLGFLAGVMASAAQASDGSSFIVFGDTPYSKGQFEALGEIAATLKARGAEGPAFAIHYGDTKSGGERCTEERLARNQDLIFGLIDGPMFFTPGDNDWTDCDRKGDDELEILDKLLIPLYFSPDKLPENRFPQARDWGVVRQPRFVENARWQKDGITFATLHIVATGNGRAEIKVGDVTEKLDRVDARDAANLEWLAAAFMAAAHSDALVIATQADFTAADHSLPACSLTLRQNCEPFSDFEAALRNHARDFGKPVLLVHGDTNPYCLEKGYLEADNLWRFNGPGDGEPGVTEVRFEGGAFTFQHIGEGGGHKDGCPAVTH
jgi:hypothetical protein